MVNRRKIKKELVEMDIEVLDLVGYEICRNIVKSNLLKKFYFVGGIVLVL